jgi:hypothetical protein
MQTWGDGLITVKARDWASAKKKLARKRKLLRSRYLSWKKKHRKLKRNSAAEWDQVASLRRLAEFEEKAGRPRQATRLRKRAASIEYLRERSAGTASPRRRPRKKNRRSSPRQLAYRKLVKRYGVKGASRHWRKRK